MKTGLPSLLLCRAISPRRRKIGREFPLAAYVHGVGFNFPAVAFVDVGSEPVRPVTVRTSHPVAMFNRAVKAAEANQHPRPAIATTSSAALKKQLFPSSSPNGNITDMFKKASAPQSSTTTFRASAATDPLQSRSTNINKPPTHQANGKAFASLYNRPDDPFKESSEQIKVGDGARSLSHNAMSAQPPAVYFADDDFSDDENLDLDFSAPSSLPTLPALPKLPPAKVSPKQNHPPPSQTSVLSWSQSSPSHMRPPPVRQEPPRQQPPQRPNKRVSPETTEPVKKKRQLPSSYAKSKVEEIDVEALYHDATTPASKIKPPPLWDTTASAVKEQKKQLKKAISSNKAEASPAEMQNAMKSTALRKATPISLSDEQEHVKKLVVEKGQSVFFTGPAGTGKSVLMRSIIAALKKKYARDPEKVAVTASTGLAACNIGGMTLHSFAGIGLGKEDAQTLVKKVRRNPKAKNRWLKTKALIIDEVSMVDGELFDKLSQVGRIIRNNGRPWGGIQLVITGDFFQLPPVPDNGNKQKDSKFAFDAATWSTSIDHTIGLTEVFRQRDSEFANMLNEMRLGKISEQTVRTFQALSRPLKFDDGLEVTELFPTRNEVDGSNLRRLKALPGKSYRYDALDTGDPAVREKLLSNMMAPPSIELKENAQVMLIKNMDGDLVNGSLGTVIAFKSQTEFDLTNGDGGSDVESDAKKRVRAFASALSGGANQSDNRKYPLVRFHFNGGSRTILCVPEDWKVELPTGEVQASRKQLPLILAWALSIHKAQGQTLERVKVDLGKVFEKGQAYVALSRATTQEGLQVLRFNKDKVMAHPRVVAFYNQLYSAESAMKKRASSSITSYTYSKSSTPEVVPKARQQSEVKAGIKRQQSEVIDLDEEEAMASYA